MSNLKLIMTMRLPAIVTSERSPAETPMSVACNGVYATPPPLSASSKALLSLPFQRGSEMFKCARRLKKREIAS